MTAHSAVELIRARQVASNYVEMAVEIEATADQRGLQKMPLTVRILREWARIARRAARAEESDPEVVVWPADVTEFLEGPA